MTGRDRATFFRGQELPRFLLLAALTVAGWAAVWLWWGRGGGPPAPASRPAAAPLPLPPPDDSPEFQGLQDRTGMSFRDNAAYAALLERVRHTPWEELNRISRRDVTFAQLIEDPARYRGLPIHLEGTLLRVIRQDVSGSQIFRSGVYYEGYATTPDSGGNPWILAFETLPQGITVGPELLNQPITFNGYFLKLLAYEAGIPYEKGEPRPDRRFRSAPVLVGRFPPAPTARPAADQPSGARWILVLLGGLTLYFVARFALQLRRLGRARTPLFQRREIVVDTIEPEQLSAWVEEQAREPAEPSAPQPNGQADSADKPSA